MKEDYLGITCFVFSLIRMVGTFTGIYGIRLLYKVFIKELDNHSNYISSLSNDVIHLRTRLMNLELHIQQKEILEKSRHTQGPSA